MQTSEYARIYALEDEHWWYRGVHDLVEDIVRARGRKDLAILDAGCGTGGLLAQLQHYGTVAGCDYADEALACCRQRGFAAVVHADLNTWAPDENRYDVIVSVDVLYHAAIADDLAIVKKLARGLRSGGVLILHLPAFNWLRRRHDVAVATKRRYTRHDVRAMVVAAGLRPRMLTYRLPWLFGIAVMQKMWETLCGTVSTAHSDLQPVPGWLNRALLSIVHGENIAVRWGLAMPLGTSVFCVAEK